LSDLSRIDGRRTRLLAALERLERVPVVFGRSDCLMRLADTVQAMTGVDHGARFRGRYTTEAGGYRVLKRAGFDGPIGYLTAPDGCGFAEIHPSRAQDGDIGAILRDRRWAFGVIVGDRFYPAGVGGLAILPRGRVERAFSVT
jgi:hypothetical protein